MNYNGIVNILACKSEDILGSVTDKDGRTFFVYYKDVLEIINRQKADNERLREEKAKFDDTILYDLEQVKKIVEEAKAEAIKEFAEKLKNKILITYKSTDGTCIYELDNIAIDSLVKEMVGDTE